MDDLLDDNCEPICEDLDRDCSDEVCAPLTSGGDLSMDDVIRVSRCQLTCMADECPDQPTDGPDVVTDGPDGVTDAPSEQGKYPFYLH